MVFLSYYLCIRLLLVGRRMDGIGYAELYSEQKENISLYELRIIQYNFGSCSVLELLLAFGFIFVY